MFFYYQDGKLCAGPPWDYDHAMGSGSPDIKSGNYKKASLTEGVYAGTMHFYTDLCAYDWFMDKVRTIFADNRAYIANIAADGGLIDTLAQTYSAQIERNYSAAGWSVTRQWSAYQRKPLPTYQNNLDFLKSWCQERFAWLDGYLTGSEGSTEQTDATEPPEIGHLLGDADDDGSITVLDATVIRRVLAEMPVDSYYEPAADADNDGVVTILDATTIQRFLAELPVDAKIGGAI